MQWIQKNITISVIITLLCGYGAGAMAYGIMKNDINDLKNRILTLPERLARVEEKLDGVSKGVDFLIKRQLDK